MSSPVTVSGCVTLSTFSLSSLHQSVGISKSPKKMPVAGPVSTRVNPVAKRPSSYVASHTSPVFSHFTSSNVTSKSLPREPNVRPSKSLKRQYQLDRYLIHHY